jgi:hypothetical protein
MCHPDRGMLVEIVHPGHGDAARHSVSRLLEVGHRTGTFGPEPLVLRCWSSFTRAESMPVRSATMGFFQILATEVLE